MKNVILTPLVVLLITVSSVGYAAADPAATPAETTTSKAPATQAKNQKKDPANEVICTTEAQLGSLIGKRVCRTRAQIEARKRDEQEMVRENTMRQPYSSPN